MQADTGTKMVHVGKNTRSRIVSKGISAGNSVNAYRGLVQVRDGSCSSVAPHKATETWGCERRLLGRRSLAGCAEVTT